MIVFARRRLRHKNQPTITTTRTAPKVAPMPTPTAAPVLNPEEAGPDVVDEIAADGDSGRGVTVVEGGPMEVADAVAVMPRSLCVAVVRVVVTLALMV